MSMVVASGSGGGMKYTGGTGGGNGGRKRNEKRRIPLLGQPVVTSSSPSDDDDGVDENEAQNALKSLEDSLPIKKGLSNFYNGKSKSFVNLSGEESRLKMKELEKSDYQMNKKRRLIVEEALSRKIRRLSLPVLIKSKKDEGSSKNKSNGQDESDDQLI
ncbi:unnamed protein product [Fraxinus pennsylvanica]|uniref:Uncharacterized protein n=1 Tax=Fraxinus pennsylvanica TaxID=56036 RepID=A0AAD2EBS1_9LAMI|nr:unnamed protein product [Fraxinus pennsylvanica]